ncbi:MAG TPA: hypothetical protein VNT58_11005 [Gaiellaceae bacterium]|nr:hypothetical protein [Gaiellaceae bacterium]
MGSKVRTGGSPRGYGSALGDLRRELAPTLRSLEAAAADPLALEDAAPSIPSLQYALHAAAERVAGLEPLPGGDVAHDELVTALAIAREETADVAETVDEAGAFAAAPQLWEWRAALFGVRFALARLDGTLDGDPGGDGVARRLLPVGVLAVGVAAVVGGALAALWPLWLAGLVAVVASAALTHLRP